MKVNEQIIYHEGGRGAILKLKISVVEELISCFCPEGVKTGRENSTSRSKH